MRVSLRTTDLQITPDEEKLLISRMQKLSRLVKSFEKKGAEIRVWAEVARDTFHHKKGPVFHAEIQLHLPGKDLRSEEVAEDVKRATSLAVRDMQRQIKHFKTKLDVSEKRGSRLLKRLLRRGR